MPSLIKPHFPPSTMRCHFSPERILPPPPFAMKTSFLPEGPLVSVVALGVDVAPGRNGTGRHSSREKLKQVCSTLLHWEDDKFKEVEVIRKCSSACVRAYITSSKGICVQPS
jgi:hypothetical protein